MLMDKSKKALVKGHALPEIEVDVNDWICIAEGAIGILCGCTGTFLIAKDFIALGLLSCMFGAAITNDAIVTFTSTSQAVVRGFLRYCNGVLKYMSDDPAQKNSDKLEDIRERLKKIRTEMETREAMLMASTWHQHGINMASKP